MYMHIFIKKNISIVHNNSNKNTFVRNINKVKLLCHHRHFFSKRHKPKIYQVTEIQNNSNELKMFNNYLRYLYMKHTIQ